MDKRVVAVCVVLLGIGLAAITTGMAFEGISGVPGATHTPIETGTVYDATGGGGDGSGGSGGDGGTDAPPFSLVVDGVEECGQTCRDVTVTLTNHRNESAAGVVVHTRIYAGNGTDDSDEVWAGSQDVGALGAGEAVAVTAHVELGYRDAFEVRERDGWVTVRTTIRADDTTVTFLDRQQVT